jgi:hypothetical protein
MFKNHTKTYWALAILPALLFLLGAYLKLTAHPMEVEGFAFFGYSLGFMYFIGACELLGALGLLFGQVIDERLPRLAAVGLIIILLGALYTHATHPPLLAGIPALVLLVLLGLFLKVSKDSGQMPAARAS